MRKQVTLPTDTPGPTVVTIAVDKDYAGYRWYLTLSADGQTVDIGVDVMRRGTVESDSFPAWAREACNQPDVAVEPVDRGEYAEAELSFAVTTPEGPNGQTPHSLRDESVFEETGERMEASPDAETEFRGIDFGSRVHDFAETYALGEDVALSNPHDRGSRSSSTTCRARCTSRSR